MFCHKCGANLPADVVFCNKCGTKLGAGDASPAVNEPISTPTPIQYTPVQQAPIQHAPVQQAPIQPTQPAQSYVAAPSIAQKGKSKKPIFAIAGVALVAVIAIIVVVGFGNNRYIETVRTGHFVIFPDATIDELFENFYVNTRWSHSQNPNGDNIVDFRGVGTLDGRSATFRYQFLVPSDSDEFAVIGIFIDDVSQPLWHLDEWLIILIEALGHDGQLSGNAVTPQPETRSEIEIPANIGGVNAETFAFIRDGMSIDQVRELIGVEPAGESVSEIFGVVSTGITWTEGLTTITVIFTDGYVTSTQILSLGDGTSDAGVGQGAAGGDATIDMSDWRTVYNANSDMGVGFSITFPLAWRYQRFVGGYDLEIISPYGDFTIADVLLSPSIFEEWVFDGSISWEYFQFDDGYSGYMVIHQNHIVWARNSGLRLHFHHSGNMVLFHENEDVILRVAGSLTSGQAQTPAQQELSEPIVQELSRQESELVGIWFVLNPFWAWHEEIEEGDIIMFNADGTGRHDSFGFGTDLGEFTWHIEIAEGWDGPTVFLTPTLFMNFPNLTISFMLNEGDTIFQDPFGDGNWVIPLHQDAGAPFYLEPFMP